MPHGEFIKLKIKLLADLAATGNEKLHRLTSIGIKTYRKVKVFRPGIDAGSPCESCLAMATILMLPPATACTPLLST